ncbi:hypothetical protein V1523DRAFT_436027 [Lipomyces doorenjongii]
MVNITAGSLNFMGYVLTMKLDRLRVILQRVYFQNQLNSSGFTIVPIHPGLVVTDMNPFGAISSEESAKKMFDAVDALSVKDEFFLRNYDGSVLAW